MGFDPPYVPQGGGTVLCWDIPTPVTVMIGGAGRGTGRRRVGGLHLLSVGPTPTPAMSAPRAWRCSACAILVFVASTLNPVFGFLPQPGPNLNNVAKRWSLSGRLTPTATAMLPGGAAEAVGHYSLRVSHAAEVVGNEAAATSTAAAQMVLAGGILDDMDPAKLGLFAFAGLGVAAAGFSTAVYWRMQYVVSAWWLDILSGRSLLCCCLYFFLLLMLYRRR